MDSEKRRVDNKYKGTTFKGGTTKFLFLSLLFFGCCVNSPACRLADYYKDAMPLVGKAIIDAKNLVAELIPK